MKIKRETMKSYLVVAKSLEIANILLSNERHTYIYNPLFSLAEISDTRNNTISDLGYIRDPSYQSFLRICNNFIDARMNSSNEN